MVVYIPIVAGIGQPNPSFVLIQDARRQGENLDPPPRAQRVDSRQIVNEGENQKFLQSNQIQQQVPATAPVLFFSVEKKCFYVFYVFMVIGQHGKVS